MSPTPWSYPKSSDGMSISATVRPLVGLLGGEGGGGPVLDNWDRSLKIEARAFPFQSLYVMSSMSLFFALAFRVWTGRMGVEISKEL